jgi:hypothetical protein
MITDKYSTIEPKGKPRFDVQNFKLFIFASNSDWPAPIEIGDRRFFIVVVSDAHIKDYDYFAAIKNELENGGYQALMYYFLNRDISDFNPRKKPFSEHDFAIKMQGANSVQKWWFALLNDSDPSTWEQIVAKKVLYNDYLAWITSNKSHVVDNGFFGKEMKKLVKHIEEYRPSKQERQYMLGTLKQCKKSFENLFDASPNIWDEF